MNDTLRVVATLGATPPVIVDLVKTYTAVPCWAPTSDRLAYYASPSGSFQLWVYDVRTRTKRQLSFVEGGIAPDVRGRFSGWGGDPLLYTWAPDGRTIAFGHQVALENPEGKPLIDLIIKPPPRESLAAGRPLVLTTNTPRDWTLQGVVAYHVGYAFKNGEWVAVADTSFQPRMSTQLFLLDAATGRTRQLTRDTTGYFTPAWSPDGKRLAYMSVEGRPLAGFGPEESNIYTLEVASGRATRVTTGPMQKTLPQWSRDGRWIAYLGRAGFSRDGQGVYVVPSGGSVTPRFVTANLDRFVQSFDWAPAGDTLVISYADGLARPIARADVAGGGIMPLSPAAAVTQGFSASSTAVAWIQSMDPSAPTQLWLHQRVGRASKPVADVVPAANAKTARHQEVVRWRNSRGDEMEGLVLLPVDYVPARPYPTIVDAYSNGVNRRLTGEYNLIKVSGSYVVFLPNHRAPHMWVNPMKSADYDLAAAGPNGVAVMVDDMLTGVDTLVRRGLIDQDRMCIFGFSNGGLEAEQILTQTARFKCAALQSPGTSDWLLSFFLSTDDPGVIRWMNGIAPWQDPSLYTALGPLFHADKIRTPVLLAVGDRENLTLLTTIEMYNALRYLKRDVTLLRYADQGHGFTGAAEADFEARMKAFFDSHLQ